MLVDSVCSIHCNLQERRSLLNILLRKKYSWFFTFSQRIAQVSRYMLQRSAITHIGFKFLFVYLDDIMLSEGYFFEECKIDLSYLHDLGKLKMREISSGF